MRISDWSSDVCSSDLGSTSPVRPTCSAARSGFAADCSAFLIGLDSPQPSQSRARPALPTRWRATAARALLSSTRGLRRRPLDLPLAELWLTPEALVAAARVGQERIAELYPMPRGTQAK